MKCLSIFCLALLMGAVVFFTGTKVFAGGQNNNNKVTCPCFTASDFTNIVLASDSPTLFSLQLPTITPGIPELKEMITPGTQFLNRNVACEREGSAGFSTQWINRAEVDACLDLINQICPQVDSSGMCAPL